MVVGMLEVPDLIIVLVMFGAKRALRERGCRCYRRVGWSRSSMMGVLTPPR
jgi:hypothetical protein